MDEETKQLYAEISILNQQVGWLTGSLENIAKGETLDVDPSKYATWSLDGFKRRYGA